MGVGRKPAAGLQFAAEILELCDGESAFQEGARINARGSMSLKIDGVAFEFLGAGAEKMIEAYFEQRGRGGVRGDVAADVVFDAVGADDHGQGVPANQALDAALDFLFAGK